MNVHQSIVIREHTPRPLPPETIRLYARQLVRRSAVYCEVIILPGGHDISDVLCDELQITAEYTETEPSGTRIFLGELPNGAPWQIKVAMRPTTSWDTKVDPNRSPLKGLVKLDPPIVVTPAARKRAAKRLERATRPYRTKR
jgi:hypothetical protein